MFYINVTKPPLRSLPKIDVGLSLVRVKINGVGRKPLVDELSFLLVCSFNFAVTSVK